MSRTSWRLSDLVVADIAVPYDDEGQPLPWVTFADYPDGGLRTSIRDITAFMQVAIRRGWAGKAS